MDKRLKTKDETGKDFARGKRIGKKLIGYSALAGAALASGATQAEATIISSDTLATSITLSGSSASRVIDFNGDTVGDVLLKFRSTTFSSSSYRSGIVVGSGVNVVATTNTTNTYARRLASNDTIDSGLFGSGNSDFGLLFGQFTYVGPVITSSGTYGPFGAGDQGFVGISFDISGNTHFAWIELKVGSLFDSLTIRSYAYENEAGVAIKAGVTETAVPEPATLLTLAMGAAGLIAWRRRQGKQKKKYNKTS